MDQTVRVIVANTDEDVARDLRAALLSIPGVKIVAEIDEPALLSQAIDQFPAEVLLIHLDPNPSAIMDVVAPLIEQRREQIAAIAMTDNRDAELVMRAMRSGMREFLWKPFPPEQLRETLLRVATDSPNRPDQVGKLITVVGTGGGMGATQLVTNIAVELAQLDQPRGAGPGSASAAGSRGPGPASAAGIRRHPRVAAADLDFRFGQVAMQLDAQPNYTIAELCETPEQIDTQMIERAMHKHPTGVHVLARPSDLAQANQISAGQTAGALAALQQHYDYVVVDMPARFDHTARAVYDMADIYLLVIQLMVPSVRTADRLLQELTHTGYSLDRIRMVCNRYGRDTGYLEPGDVEATLKLKIDFMVPDDWRVSAAAVNMGAPLLAHAPKSKLRMAYRQIAVALAGGAETSNDQAAGLAREAGDARKSLFGFLAGAKT